MCFGCGRRLRFAKRGSPAPLPKTLSIRLPKASMPPRQDGLQTSEPAAKTYRMPFQDAWCPGWLSSCSFCRTITNRNTKSSWGWGSGGRTSFQEGPSPRSACSLGTPNIGSPNGSMPLSIPREPHKPFHFSSEARFAVVVTMLPGSKELFGLILIHSQNFA